MINGILKENDILRYAILELSNDINARKYDDPVHTCLKWNRWFRDSYKLEYILIYTWPSVLSVRHYK